jgi:hypothetical protein
MAKHRSFKAQSWSIDLRALLSSSPTSPAQPSQIPSLLWSSGCIALARPPELLSVLQPSPAFRKVRGRRFETIRSRLVMSIVRFVQFQCRKLVWLRLIAPVRSKLRLGTARGNRWGRPHQSNATMVSAQRHFKPQGHNHQTNQSCPNNEKCIVVS